MLKLITLALLLVLCFTFKPCEPFGPRTFYGQAAVGTQGQKLEIYFNTASECSRSYIQLVRKSGMERIQCAITPLHLSASVNNYQTYIHKCKVNSINYEEVFYYNVFGWDGTANSPIPYAQDFIQYKLADITDPTRKMQLIVLADWSQIEKNIAKYKPIDHDLQVTQNEKEINGLLINGDIGYDLDTNNCSNYEKFIVMLSRTAVSVPIIIATGNHEYNTADNYALFVNSFQLYGLDTTLATGLQLGSIYLLAFDPYQVLFTKKITTDPSLQPFLKQLESAKKQGRFVIPTSHYPLACSGTSKNCKNDRKDLKAYWDAMLHNKVSLYLGAHYHTYQRIFPYQSDGTFSTQNDSYRAQEGYLISIVEGVAGNDKDIVESITTIESFTASHTVNETGFGLMSVDTTAVKYSHFSTTSGETDAISIARVQRGNLVRE